MELTDGMTLETNTHACFAVFVCLFVVSFTAVANSMFETVNGVALKLANHIIQLETILSKTAPSLLKIF